MVSSSSHCQVFRKTIHAVLLCSLTQVLLFFLVSSCPPRPHHQLSTCRYFSIHSFFDSNFRCFWIISPLKKVRRPKNRESRNSCTAKAGGVGVSWWSVSSSLSSAKIFMAAAMYDAILSYLAAARRASSRASALFILRFESFQVQHSHATISQFFFGGCQTCLWRPRGRPDYNVTYVFLVPFPVHKDTLREQN